MKKIEIWLWFFFDETTNTNTITKATSPFEVAPEPTVGPPDPEEPVPSVPP
jgi:hypothetical protein